MSARRAKSPVGGLTTTPAWRQVRQVRAGLKSTVVPARGLEPRTLGLKVHADLRAAPLEASLRIRFSARRVPAAPPTALAYRLAIQDTPPNVAVHRAWTGLLQNGTDSAPTPRMMSMTKRPMASTRANITATPSPISTPIVIRGRMTAKRAGTTTFRTHGGQPRPGPSVGGHGSFSWLAEVSKMAP